MFAPNDFSFLVRRIEVFGEHAVNGRFERRLLFRKNIATSPRDTAPISFAWVRPSNLKAESISVMLLCAFDISDRQLRYWLAIKRWNIPADAKHKYRNKNCEFRK